MFSLRLLRRDAYATEFEFLVFSTRFCFKQADLTKELVGSAHPTFLFHFLFGCGL